MDLARRGERFGAQVLAAIERVVRSGHLLLGPELEAFERELAAYCGRRHAVGVASGTDALSLALRSLNIGEGDEVIIPALTAIPTAVAVCDVGAIPVPVDVDATTATINGEAIKAALTERTKAVIPVHLYGRRANIPDVGLPIIEDGAQALGALDASSGAIAAALSFYPTKNLGGITDGGAVITDSDEVAERIRLLRTHAQQTNYQHTEISGHSRLSEIAAAALRCELPSLDGDNARRREIANAYRTASPSLRWQDDDPNHVYHLCVVRVKDRDKFRAEMPFDTAVHYPVTIPNQVAYSHFARGECPEADAWAAECVSLPCFPEMTDSEVELVCQALR